MIFALASLLVAGLTLFWLIRSDEVQGYSIWTDVHRVVAWLSRLRPAGPRMVAFPYQLGRKNWAASVGLAVPLCFGTATRTAGPGTGRLPMLLERVRTIYRDRLRLAARARAWVRLGLEKVSDHVRAPRPLFIRVGSQSQTPPHSHAEIAGGAAGGASVQVAARGGDRGVPEGSLHEVDGRAAVEAMAGVRMAQPMRRDLGREAGPRGGGFDDQMPNRGHRVFTPPSGSVTPW